jgi:hypothetical protein
VGDGQRGQGPDAETNGGQPRQLANGNKVPADPTMRSPPRRAVMVRDYATGQRTAS